MPANCYPEDVNGQHNAYHITCTIPTEVLANIFRFLVVFDPPASGKPGQQLGWIASTTHVCSHWRAVALGTPRLWSTPIFSFPKEVWAKEMLLRARRATLSLRLNATNENPWTQDAWRLSLAEDMLSSRLHDLHLIFLLGTSEVFRRLQACMLRPAPVLKDLVLLGVHSWDIDPDYTLTTMSADLISGDAPALRSLRLRYVHLPWESALFSRLEQLDVLWLPPQDLVPSDTFLRPFAPPSITLAPLHLDIGVLNGSDSEDYGNFIEVTVSENGTEQANVDTDVNEQTDDLTEDGHPQDTASPAPTLSRMITVLDAMPNLHTLELMHCLPSLGDSSPSSNAQISHLPNLERVCLAGEVRQCTQLMDSVVTPSLRYLDIECYAYDAQNFHDIIHVFFRHLQRPHQSLGRNPVSHVAISTLGQGYGFKITLNMKGIEHTVLSVSFRLAGYGRWDRSGLLRHMFTDIPVHDAEVLNVEGSVSHDRSAITFAEWVECLPHFKSLRTIRLKPSTAQRLLFSLHPLLSGSLLLPQLVAIICPTIPGRTLPRTSSLSALLRAFMRRLLHDRQKAGYPLAFVDRSGAPLCI